MLPTTLNFEGVALRIVDRQARPWMPVSELTRALYGIKGTDRSVSPFEQESRAVRRIFNRNRDEFDDDMTALLTMETGGGPQEVRIFSTRGCYLMGMLAKTERAKAFRRWVLDVLEGKVAASVQKEAIAERRMRVMELNAAGRALELLRSAGGYKAVATNAPEIYGRLGMRIDMSAAFDQRELPLDSQSEAA